MKVPNLRTLMFTFAGLVLSSNFTVNAAAADRFNPESGDHLAKARHVDTSASGGGGGSCNGISPSESGCRAALTPDQEAIKSLGNKIHLATIALANLAKMQDGHKKTVGIYELKNKIPLLLDEAQALKSLTRQTPKDRQQCYRYINTCKLCLKGLAALSGEAMAGSGGSGDSDDDDDDVCEVWGMPFYPLADDDDDADAR